MNPRSWTLVRTEHYNFMAEIVRGLLEAQRIEVFLSREGYQTVFGFDGPPHHRVDILVPEEAAEAARKLLADYDSGRLQEDAARDGDA
jgi:hypothetical protein